MNLTIISPILIVTGSVFFIFLERYFPYDSGERFFRKGLFTDLVMYGLLQSYLLSFLIFGFISYLDSLSGFSRLKLVSDWPLIIQLIFFLVSHDLYIYWFHRLQHKSKFFWRIHEAHHSSTKVDWIAGMRSHSLEILINQTIEFAPIILLGAAPEIVLLKGVLDGLWGMWIHSNINAKTGWLQYVINGPEMHRWHHAKEITEGGINFGTKFAFWDWIFRTAYLPQQKPSGYGLGDSEFPENYFSQHLFAFRKFEKK